MFQGRFILEIVGLQTIFFGVLLLLHNPLLSFIPVSTVAAFVAIFLGSFIFLTATRELEVLQVVKTLAGFFIALAFFGMLSQDGSFNILQLGTAQTTLQVGILLIAFAASSAKFFKNSPV